MRIRARNLMAAFATLALVSTINYQVSTCRAQSTAFTYQGQLQNNSSLANGTFNLMFTLFGTNISGTAVAGPVTNNDVIVSNGLFTVQINFGASVWNGATNWLQIGVEPNKGGGFTTLSPRQEVTPVPYGIYAENAITLASGAAIGTGLGNSISSSGAVYSFIGGGQNNTILAGDNEAVIGGGAYNTNSGGYATIGGGVLNVVSGGAATVGGGQGNTASASYATVAGGIINAASGAGSFIGGGGYDGTYAGNQAQAAGATIGGGVGNSVLSGSTDGFIGGGSNNKIQGANYATIAAGNGNQIQSSSANSSIGGGSGNTINANNSASAIAGGSGNTIQTGDDNAFIGGGYENLIASNLIHSTIGGGVQNKIQGYSSYVTIAGGNGNQVQSNSSYSTIGGGGGNTIAPDNSASGIAGGSGNTINGNNDNSFIGGGYLNNIAEGDSFSTIGGGEGNQVYLGGGASYATIAGGNDNLTLDSYTFIGGGYENDIYPGGTFAAISGGSSNLAYGLCSTVPGGANNYAQGNFSFAAGQQAQANYQGDFVWADSQNATFASTANDQFLIRAEGGVGIGTNSPTAGLQVFSTNQIQMEVDGTSRPVIRLAQQGFSTECDMVARPEGGMDWYASYPGGTELMSLIGYPSVQLQVNGELYVPEIQVTGNVLVSGSQTNIGDVLMAGNLTVNSSITSCGYNLCSDRNVKKNISSIDPEEVLDKVSALPITEWQYNTTPGAEHVGPMAQDFHAAFGLNGGDDTHISVVDEGGVALAAIQGLNQKVEAGGQKSEAGIQKAESQIEKLEQKLEQKETEITELKARLEKLEQVVGSKTEVKEK